MSSFDIIINLIESILFCSFILISSNALINRINISYYLLFVLLTFINRCFFNYFSFPEIFYSFCSFTLMYILSCLLTKKIDLFNLFIICYSSFISNISITTSMVTTNALYGFPFYNGEAYIFVVIVSKIIFFY